MSLLLHTDAKCVCATCLIVFIKDAETHFISGPLVLGDSCLMDKMLSPCF